MQKKMLENLKVPEGRKWMATTLHHKASHLRHEV